MPKSGAPTSHEAIKRSLKSKFKLILSENRILVETINGYVKRAEKVYREMESTDIVTPKQFSKAMEKLERAYSACVRLILVASDLFEKGDSEGMKNREAMASSCGSETSVYSSESSATITHANRGGKGSNEKAAQKRSRSSDMRLNDGIRGKAKTQQAGKKGRLSELAENIKGETTNAGSERLFVLPGSCSDFDHLIELQRFLHGLEREKLQKDQPSPPCITAEKQSGCSQAQHVADPCEGLFKQVSPEESHSLSQRLKILKSAIENFKDRSSGDERVTQALNDIKELALKQKEQCGKDNCREFKLSLNMLASPGTDSMSNNAGSKISHCGKLEHSERIQKILLAKQKRDVSMNQQSYQRDSYVMNTQDQQNLLQGPKSSQGKDQVSHETMRQEVSNQQTCEQKMSPITTTQLGEDGKDDIHQIIVNKIVDMVSAKLVPWLQTKNGQDKQAFMQYGSDTGVDDCLVEDNNRYASNHAACQDTTYAQQKGFCGSFTHCPQIPRQPFSPQYGQQQQDMLHPKRCQQRQKVVSFMDDFGNQSSYNSWNYKMPNNSSKFMVENSPTQMSDTFMYAEKDTEQTQSYHKQHVYRFSSPHKKRVFSAQQPLAPNRSKDQPMFQQQCPPARIKQRQSVDESPEEQELETYNEGAESEQAYETDSEAIKEYHEDQYKPTSSYKSMPWAGKVLTKSNFSLEAAEYQALRQPKRSHVIKQEESKKSESFDRVFPNRSTEIKRKHLAALEDIQDRRWFHPMKQPVKSEYVDESSVRQREPNSKICPSNTLAEILPQGQITDEDADQHLSESCNWAKNRPSPRPVLTHSEQQIEQTRQFPFKMPRSTPPKMQPKHSVGSYTNCVSNQSGYVKPLGNDVVRQPSETSCEGSPLFSTEERVDTVLANSRDELEVKESARPEVVFIDTNQLHADASRTITLSNLPLHLDESELLDIFKKYGHVSKIYYIKDRNTGMFQGRAYGKFSKASEAYQAAQDLQNLVLDGHEVCVQLYVTTP